MMQGKGRGGGSIVRDPKGQRLRHEEQGTFLLGTAWSPDVEAEIRRGRELRDSRLDWLEGAGLQKARQWEMVLKRARAGTQLCKGPQCCSHSHWPF